MTKTAIMLAGIFALGMFGVAQAGEGNGHPFEFAGSSRGQSSPIMAGAPGNDTGAEAYPAFAAGQQSVGANVAARDTGADGYQDYAGQAAAITGSIGLAQASRGGAGW